MTLGRELIQIVEIDIERCSLTYGASPCTAVLGTTGNNKCLNCFAGCQDKDNFTTETETLRFAMNVDGLPKTERIYTCMSSPVSTNPSWINLGGVSDKSGPLGKRSRRTIKLQDFTDHDIWFDRYQSERVSGAAQASGVGYQPVERSTFLAKLRHRFPYYVGRNSRVLEGEAGQPLSAMRKSHSIITDWEGPSADGSVTITTKDALDLADDKKAQCPKPSQGKIIGDVAISGGSFDLTPTGVGADYAASGRASIGSECVSYTISGDTVTLTGRGLDGTDAATHSDGDLFQQAYRVENGDIANVANDLLTTYAGIDASFIDLAEWQAESSRWLAGFNLTTTIMKPTGVLTLLGELAQLGAFWWWDDVAQKIKMRANRPLDYDEVAPSLSDDNTFIEKSIAIKDLEDERLSRVLLWNGIVDVSKSATTGENYSRVSVPIDTDAEGEDEYNQVRLLEVFSRWLGDGSDSIANAVAGRLLERYKSTPQQITFSFDVKDVGDVELASPVSITSRLLVDDFGEQMPTEMQITSLEEVIPGHRLKATAQSYQYSGNYGFITENSRPVYGSSTEAQKDVGTYFIDENDDTFADGRGPYIWF